MEAIGFRLDKWLFDERIRWEPPSRGEREPTYSGRVIIPKIRHLARLEGLENLVVKGDGPHQQGCDSVLIAGRRVIPDISIQLSQATKLAVEVKYVDGSIDPVKQAIGQAVLYLSGSYRASRVLFISKDGTRKFTSRELDRMNDYFPGGELKFFEIAQ